MILLVNKPDWFEQEELTYLGFSNDKSEVPTVLSDKIDFAINYSDTSKKFLDGTSYDGTIQGQNKILKMASSSGISWDANSGYYTCPDNGSMRLTFPHKGLLKLKVAPRIEKYTVTNCDTLATGTLKTSGPLTYRELSRGGTSTMMSSLPSGGGWWDSICYGNDKFVAVFTLSDKAVYSTDGINWTTTTMSSSRNWRSICYGNGKFVVGLQNGNVSVWSADGIKWNDGGNFPSSDNWWNSVCYGNGKYVAICYGGGNSAAYSTDGISWTKTTTPSNGWSVCYGNGKFVAIPYNTSSAVYSTNGINWTGSECQLSFTKKGKISITTTGSGTLTFKSGVSDTISYPVSGTQTTEIGGDNINGDTINYFLSEGVYTKEVSIESENHVNFLQFTAGVSGDTTVHSVSEETSFTIDSSKMTAGSEGAYYIDVSISVLKLISAEITNQMCTIVNPVQKTYNAFEEIIETRQKGNILEFGTRPVTKTGKFVYSITGCNSVATGTTKTSGVLTFANRGSSGGISTLPSDATSVCYGNGKFVAVGSRRSAYSTDGINWTIVTVDNNDGILESICYGNGMFVAGESPGDFNVYYSTDGINWRIAGSSLYIDQICYGDGKFVGAGSGRGYYSTNGINWTRLSGMYGRAVCYGNGKFVAVDSSEAYYSTDGINWKRVTGPSSRGMLLSICYGGGKYVAVGHYSEAAYSSDGINWSGGNTYELSFTNKGKISITTSGSGTLTFTSGVSGTTEYSVSGTQTTIIDESRLTDLTLTYTLSSGYTTEVSIEGNDTVAINQPCLWSTSSSGVVWALTNSSTGAVTVANPSLTKSGDRYYADIPDGYTDKCALVFVSRTETVYDLIDFVNTSSPKAANGILSLSGLSGTNSSWLYTVTSASGARITAAARGTIELTIMPKMDVDSGTIRLKYGSNTNTQTITGKTTITIAPSDMQKSGTGYYMDFNATNLVFLTAKFVKWEPEFIAPPLPSFSSTVDFSKSSNSKPVHASTSLAVFGKDANGTLGTISYDSSLGYWCITGTNNNFYDMQPYAKGDGYLLVEDLSASSSTLDIWYGVSGTKASRWKYCLPGLTRLYFDAEQMNPSNGFASAGKHKFIVGGVTQPINAALYNYVYGTSSANLNSYITPTTDFNRAALKQLTTAACSKLKADYGSDVRVYMVKYRKQDYWKALTRNSTNAHSSSSVAHSYTEIDNCASLTGGTSYTVTSEASLKTTLDTIAENIKKWAEYEEAKNVAE